MAVRRMGLAATALLLTLSQTGCLVIGGHSSHGNWLYVPGGLGTLVVILLVILVLRR
jgi:hypothetical protein